MGTALVGISAPAAAEEVPGSVDPTVSEVGFIEARVEPGYMEGEAVSEEVGDLHLSLVSLVPFFEVVE